MEHQKGRVIVGELADAARGYAAGGPPVRENLVRSLRALVAFYPNHIWKEDYLLFPLAAKVLTPEDQRELIDKFETYSISGAEPRAKSRDDIESSFGLLR